MKRVIKNNFFVGLIIFGYCFSLWLLQVVINPNNRGENPQAIAEKPPENHHLVHWSYGGARNPTRWGELSEAYILCKTGKSQSPINFNLNMNYPKDAQPINFNYRNIPLKIKNNGHTIQVDYTHGSFMEIDGEKYQLRQFHFHTPSEHTVEETAYAMELHLVHQNQAGNLAVVGVFIDEGAENYFLQQIWDYLPETEAEKNLASVMVNAGNFLPESRAYYSYDGSLTTPPCSEGVKWYVMKNPITASPAQIEKFMEIYPMNARPVQPLHRRKIHQH